jgi:predicted esterase
MVSRTILALCAVAAFAQDVVVRPREINDVLLNPGIGFMTFQRFNGDRLNQGQKWTEGLPIVYQPFNGSLENPDHPPTTMAYFRVYWKFLEPERGRYRWDLIDQALQTARRRGQTLMLRVAPHGRTEADAKAYEGIEGVAADVPEWYRAMVGPWRKLAVAKWLVDPEDPRYVRHFGGFVRALAGRYDGHPDLEAVDVSILAAWGEGAGSELLTPATRAALLDAYLEGFRKTPLLMQLADKATNGYVLARRDAGWRVDCLGNMGLHSSTWSHMLDWYPQQILNYGLRDAWQRAPVSMEVCGVMQDWKDRGFDIDYIVDQSLKWHISSFNAKSSAVPPEWRPNVDRWLRKMGYRFVLRKFTYPAVLPPHGKLAFSSWWENKGVAPAYRPFPLALRLRGKRTQVLLTRADVRNWLPGDNLHDDAVFVPPALPHGEYALDIALLDPFTSQPAVKLAIRGRREDGWYEMGRVQAAFSYRSEIDGTDQPYRLFVPSSYDGTRPFPLIFALHGTSSNQNVFFDDERYGPAAINRAAEKYGALVASPYGRGKTEYRGVGENDVFAVLAEAGKRYRVDPDRIYLTGHSMGGSGSAYLALHHPDVFAAAAPLAAPYSFPWLAANAGHVPFWWVGGAADEEYYRIGVAAGVERMRRLGCPMRFTEVPGEGHFGPVKDLDAVVRWLMEQRRTAHPRQYVFEVDTPLHGRAYWSEVVSIAEPGKMAVVKARADGNRAIFELENVGELVFLPDGEVFDLSRPVLVEVNRRRVFEGLLNQMQELPIGGSPRPRRAYSLTAWRNHSVAQAPRALDIQGPESPLANWIAEAMRAATGADIALYNRMYYRGLPIPAGAVDVVDLIQCSRPFDQYLVTVRLSGRDIAEILAANAAQEDRRVFVSGSFVPDRVYTVALEGQVVERETMLLAGRFRKLQYQTTNVPFTLALYGHAAKTKRIETRVRSM